MNYAIFGHGDCMRYDVTAAIYKWARPSRKKKRKEKNYVPHDFIIHIIETY
jgi:hypothetical protein